MDITTTSKRLLTNELFAKHCPLKTVRILQAASGSVYLDLITELALDPIYTSTIFATHDDVSVDICGRWLNGPNALDDPLKVVTAIAQVLPFGRHLLVFVISLLEKHPDLFKNLFRLDALLDHSDANQSKLRISVLTLIRLLRFDSGRFSFLVSPAHIQILLQNPDPCIRYLTIQLFWEYFSLSEHQAVGLFNRYVGQEKVESVLEGKKLDLRFLDLWENQRVNNARRLLRHKHHCHDTQVSSEKILFNEDYAPSTINCGGFLLPNLNTSQPDTTGFVQTGITAENLRRLARAVKGSGAILISGPPGSGKTTLVNHLSSLVGKHESITTLHLNEQSDFRSLIGLYTNDELPSSFQWRPGCLTKAMQDGYWVLIEDLDRAPRDIVASLLPLIEQRYLHIPSQGSTIRAAHDFKILATVRSDGTRPKDLSKPLKTIMGIEHWTKVDLAMLHEADVRDIVQERFPNLRPFMPRVMQLYRVNQTLAIGDVDPGQEENSSSSRAHYPRELLRWCARIEGLFVTPASTPVRGFVSESVNEICFLEALDIFCGGHSNSSGKGRRLATLIAHALDFPQARVEYCVTQRRPRLSLELSTVRIGRCTLQRQRVSPTKTKSNASRNFAFTDPALRMLESISAAVMKSEPCLLVGETGVGKTRTVHQLADMTNNILNVVNLSQQIDASDLIGGYKPTNIRFLIIPLKEEFEDQFRLTFPTGRNERFLASVSKAVAKRRYSRALDLWQEALSLVERKLDERRKSEPKDHADQPHKRRKLGSKSLQDIRSRWSGIQHKLQRLRRQFDAGAKGFAFTFVHGKLIKAAQSGEWILLDEINLASADTLECITDLLDKENGVRSIMLTEKGPLERIHVHKDFRLFAAMNPATDVGKRELPYAIRSRFTEMNVDSPDKDLSTLTSLVKTLLGSKTESDPSISLAVSKTYIEIKKLQDTNALTDGSEHAPHFSLRNLTRALQFVLDTYHLYGLRRALYEGFHMSFSTTLDKASEKHVEDLLTQYIIPPDKISRASLSQRPPLSGHETDFVRFNHYWLPRGPFSSKAQSDYIITPFINAHLMKLVRATTGRRFPILLEGPTSAGKTSMIEYLANISGNKFVRVNNHEHTDMREYIGTYNTEASGDFQYQDGVLVKALREGYWIVLDELNLAPSDVLEALNRLLDDNRELLIPETQEIVRPHPNFMLFATQNPAGVYGGRKPLSRAFRNRFLEIHFDEIPIVELEVILRERSKIAPSFCARIVHVYEKLTKLRKESSTFEGRGSLVTLRDLFRWASREVDTKHALAQQGFMLLAERVRTENGRQMIKRTIEEVIKVQINEKDLYQRKSSGPEKKARGIVWTASARRLYYLLDEALKNSEPVLLIGDTGVGKTRMCQALAQMYEKEMMIINAHQNLETGDLIGSQRPLRNHARNESELYTELCKVLELKAPVQYALDELIDAYETLKTSVLSTISQDALLVIQKRLAQHRARFEWSDGPLVRSMRTGQHFLLDEISLAEDAVLERLNSVLEPSRSIYLAEKGTDDAPIVAAKAFRFLATMNPGGDYGKRELSPALRNRFTEIWVPPVTDQAEFKEIVEAMLQPQLTQLAKPMVDFSVWHTRQFSPQRTSVSLRELLVWTDFLNASSQDEQKFAIIQGASMVYLDAMGADPAAKTIILGSSLQDSRNACLEKLGELFHLSAAFYPGSSPIVHLSPAGLSVGGFFITCNAPTFCVDECSFCFDAPTTAANTLKVARALSLPKSILLEGSPGVGKTTLVEAIASTVGVSLTRVNLSEQTDLSDLFGSDVPLEGDGPGRFGWRDAPFLRAMRSGQWVLLDEMNLAPQAVLEGLNACLDHRGQVYIAELDQMFDRHPDFRIFAAQNPKQQGGGRKGLPDSFVDRFTVVFIDQYTRQDLLMICKHAFKGVRAETVEDVIDTVTRLGDLANSRVTMSNQGAAYEFNLRDAFRWLQLLSSEQGLTSAGNPTDFQDMLVRQRWRAVEAAAKTKSMLLVDRNDTVGRFSHNVAPIFVQHGFALLPRMSSVPFGVQQKVSPCFENGSLQESIALCVQQEWPCLLVGASGSGKSAIVSSLASEIGKKVVTVSLNADTDTMDLVGGYEQVDHKRLMSRLMGRLRNTIRSLFLRSFQQRALCQQGLIDLWTQIASDDPDMPLLLSSVEECMATDPSMDLSSILVEAKALPQASVLRGEPRFEWVDGELIEAMQRGDWLVLDNANLCNPSVLDRLNSLLEPGGCLCINEQRMADGSARIIKPHHDFRLFMTMDPVHGELSRAMRNRSVELFLPFHPHSENLNHGDVLNSEVAPFNSFTRFAWNTLDDLQVSELLAIFLDHLPFSSNDISSAWCDEVTRGLAYLDPSIMDLFLSSYNDFRSFCAVEVGLLQNIRKAYIDISSSLSLKASSFAEFAGRQPFHPFNNPILISNGMRHDRFHSLQSLGRILDAAMRTHAINAKVSALVTPTHTASVGSQGAYADRFCALEKLVSKYIAMIQSYLAMLGVYDVQTEESEINHHFQCIERLLSWAGVLLDVLGRPPPRDEIVRAVLNIGHAVISGMVAEIGSTSAGREFQEAFSAVLEDWQLRMGISMEILWNEFQYPAPINGADASIQRIFADIMTKFEVIKWKTGMSLSDLASLQRSLARGQVHRDVVAESTSLEQVRQRLVLAERECDLETNVVQPYFADVFEMLREWYTLKSNSSVADNCASPLMIQLLSLQPTTYSGQHFGLSPSTKAFENFASAAGTGQGKVSLCTIRDIFPLQFLSALDRVSGVPLRALSLLEQESKELCKYTAQLSDGMSEDGTSIVLIRLASLFKTIVGCHQHILASQTSCTYTEQLKDIIASVEKPKESVRSNPSPHLRAKTIGKSAQYLETIFDRYLQPALEYMWKAVAATSRNMQTTCIRNTAAAILHFFAGCLSLYVPDQHFDPAMKPMIEHKRHNREIEEINRRIEALIHFEQVTTGQDSSFRISFEQSRLQTLQDESLPSLIWRSDSFATSHFQQEFDAIERTIIARLQGTHDITRLIEYDRGTDETVNLLRENIASSLLRLGSSHDRFAYSDVLGPLIAMLRGLDVGLAMTSIVSPSTSVEAAEICTLSHFTPFMQLRPDLLSNPNWQLEEHDESISISTQTSILQLMALKKSVENQDCTQDAQVAMTAFQSLYYKWKIQLEEDRVEESKKSATYRYRADQHDIELAEQQEFEELFSSTMKPAVSTASMAPPRTIPRLLSQQVAELHRGIYSFNQDPMPHISLMIERTSVRIARLSRCLPEMTISPLPAYSLLPAVITRLFDHYKETETRSLQKDNASFYHDPNILEIKRWVSITTRVHARFLVLEDAEPEHETIKRVLKLADEILEIHHSTSLASMIVKVEQMHEAVYQWQSVASSQHSIKDICDDITAIIVSWRRLELLTWSRLLDEEQRAFVEKVDSWWFMAYEAIIAAPMSLIENHEDLQDHAASLFGTLEDFVSNCPRGQLERRLQLLGDFRKQLNSQEAHHPRLAVITKTVANFLGYYRNFLPLLRIDLQKKRTGFEKDLKEILQLASWKDSNVHALRESAKRSHHKLFKVVKAYRNVLAEPAQSLLCQDFPRPPLEKGEVCSQFLDKSLWTHQRSALVTCGLKVPNWASRRSRFLNPETTAEKMATAAALPKDGIESSLRLSTFTKALVQDISFLQKETPITLTKVNEGQVKYLKTRKRKLFADTLKSLRQMGFRSNLGVNILEIQDPISKVLSQTPTDIPGVGMSEGDFSFYKILNILPRLREKARSHTEELGSGEVARIKVLLESIISTIVRERNVISTTNSSITRFESIVNHIQNLWAPDVYRIERLPYQWTLSTAKMKTAIAWLEPMVQTAMSLIKKHGDMAEMDHDNLLHFLEISLSRLTKYGQELAQLPELPAQITSSLHCTTHQAILVFLSELCEEVKKLGQAHPHVKSVLDQIIVWTNLSSDNAQDRGPDEGSGFDLQELEQRLSQALDSMLVAIQGANSAISTYPSAEEENNWVVGAQSSVETTLKALQGSELCSMFKQIVSTLSELDGGDAESLQLGGAMLATSLPIIKQYHTIRIILLTHFKVLHSEICKLGATLTEKALLLLSQGFCSPQEISKGDEGISAKLEGGTGLGEGDGAEDISKDVEDDEDLTELAQSGVQDKSKADIEDQDDAVDMDHEEMEGEMGDAKEAEGDEASHDGDQSDQNDLDEGVGSVDELDPTAVDEKFWDEEDNEDKTGREKESSKEAATSRKDDRHGERQGDQQIPEDRQETEIPDNVSEDGVGEQETITHHEPDQLDPHIGKDTNLDLPPEMDFDNEEKSSVISDITNMDDMDSEVESEQSNAGIEDESQGEEQNMEAAHSSDEANNDPGDERQEVTNRADSDEVGKESETEEAGSVVDTEPERDENIEMKDVDDHTRNAEVDHETTAPSENRGFGGNPEQQEDQDISVAEPNNASHEDPAEITAEGHQRQGRPRDDQAVDLPPSGGKVSGGDQAQRPSQLQEAFKALGNAIEEWHRRAEPIQEASDNPREPGAQPQVNELADAAFEHLPDESAQADTQALGNATNEQAQPLDMQAMASGAKEMKEEAFPNEEESDDDEADPASLEDLDHQPTAPEAEEKKPEGSKHAQIQIPLREQRQSHLDAMDIDPAPISPQTSSPDHYALNTSPSRSHQPDLDDPQTRYIHDMQLTSPLAFQLTEQLRLILNPTHASKYRGGYKSGNRLNMKAVMRFYASNFRDDKIFMRRSVPQKRGYQIMLCIDDSRSMRDPSSSTFSSASSSSSSSPDDAGTLALQSLALVTKSLTMLESGEICIVAFGESTSVHCAFSDTWSDAKGAQVWSRFRFEQPRTNVRQLLERSLDIFAQARRGSRSTASGEQLWQLQIIVSDGVCEDHEAIRRLVRRALEQRIMIIFVIVDAVNKASQERGRSSILDMTQAVFEESSSLGEGGEEGERPQSKLTIKRYLDGFPFGYYPVVGDVKELPSVLSSALRQWFAEVAETY